MIKRLFPASSTTHHEPFRVLVEKPNVEPESSSLLADEDMRCLKLPSENKVISILSKAIIIRKKIASSFLLMFFSNSVDEKFYFIFCK